MGRAAPSGTRTLKSEDVLPQAFAGFSCSCPFSSVQCKWHALTPARQGLVKARLRVGASAPGFNMHNTSCNKNIATRVMKKNRDDEGVEKLLLYR